ncbi:putative glycosyltransferase [Sphingomonas paucimobilis]|nr:putative glycosyltransferase [Sphingomonas paucimobilis]
MFVINSLGSGGAERVLDNLLRTMGERAHRYDVVLTLLDEEPDMRVLPTVTERHCLRAQGGLVRSIVRLRRLVKYQRPDLVVSFLVRSNISTALLPQGRARILCERMHLSSHLAGRYSGAKLALLRRLPRWFYSRADTVLTVSEGVRHDLIAQFGLPPSLVRTINNPFDLARIIEESARSPSVSLPTHFCVAVGRLVAAKGFDQLITAYAEAKAPPALVILGEGPQRAALMRQISGLGLKDKVFLPGFVADPFAVMGRAQFLVSASHNEGFPNAITEAMALGRPVIATDCPSGPAELLGGHAPATGQIGMARYGMLVRDHDIAGLTAAINLMADDAVRDRYSAAAALRAKDFALERIAALYWAVFDALLEAETAAFRTALSDLNRPI